MGTAVMIVGIVAMIVVHEGAHFVAAKGFGMKATEAFFGFGPRIWSTVRGETEYGIKAIPLGGYVRIIGMNPFEEVAPEDEGRTYRESVFWKKSVVVLAGVFSHFVMATLLLVTVFAIWGEVTTDDDGDPIPTLTLSAIAPTTPSGDEVAPSVIAGFEAGDVLLSYEGVAVTSWEDFVDRVSVDAGATVLIGYERSGTVGEAMTTLRVPRTRGRRGRRGGYRCLRGRRLRRDRILRSHSGTRTRPSGSVRPRWSRLPRDLGGGQTERLRIVANGHRIPGTHGVGLRRER